MNLFVAYFTIFKKYIIITTRKFMVITFYQCNAFLAGNFSIANFMGGVRSCSADAKFDETQIIMKSVDLIVETCVFRISALRSLGVRHKSCVFLTIIKVLLWIPKLVVAIEMNFRLVRENF